jgi:hypothetical protein
VELPVVKASAGAGQDLAAGGSAETLPFEIGNEARGAAGAVWN